MENLQAVIGSKQAVLFDLFHTLAALESTRSTAPTTSEILGVSREEWNSQLLENSWDRLTGVERDPVATMRKMAHAIDPGIPQEVIEKATRNRIERFAEALVTVPTETQEVLSRLKNQGKTIGLISNADVSEVAAWKRSPIAGFFDSVVFSCCVGCVKPEPEIYHISMRELGVAPHCCAFVGDGGSRELEGAKNLGITTIMMTGVIKEIWPEKIAERGKHADYVIERLSELILESG